MCWGFYVLVMVLLVVLYEMKVVRPSVVCACIGKYSRSKKLGLTMHAGVHPVVYLGGGRHGIDS